MLGIEEAFDLLCKEEGMTREQLIHESMFGMNQYGICRACGFTVTMIEPDSTEGYCEGCGANRVWGAEALFMSSGEL